MSTAKKLPTIKLRVILEEPERKEEPMSSTEPVVVKATQQAEVLADQGKLPVAVEYQTPMERGLNTLIRSAKAGIAALITAGLGPLLFSFITNGDFSDNAVRGFVLAAVAIVVTVLISWAQAYSKATKDDAAQVYPQSIAPTPREIQANRQFNSGAGR